MQPQLMFLAAVGFAVYYYWPALTQAFAPQVPALDIPSSGEAQKALARIRARLLATRVPMDQVDALVAAIAAKLH